MPYICSICGTPAIRENRCESCGWVKTITVRRGEKIPKGTAYNAQNRSNGPLPISTSIVFLTEDTQHITGGRYYSWWLSTALAEAGFDVHVFTNRRPMFIDNFKDYRQPVLHIVDNLEMVDYNARCFFGSPVIGSIQAIRLAEKYGRTAYCEIFDPFPMMEIYRGQHNWPGWNWLLPNLKQPNVKIISLCETANPFIYNWLSKSEEQVHAIYPCINTIEKNKTKDKYVPRKWITFISRIDHHKKIGHVLDAVRLTDHELHIITSVDGVGLKDMVRIRGMEKQVVVHHNIDDKTKFQIIKKSACTINGSIWEGFGIWLAESLACGVPAVCYDFPTFHEIVDIASRDVNKIGELVYFADWNDSDDLGRQLQKCLAEGKRKKTNDIFSFAGMVKDMKKMMKVETQPRIGVVMIVLNEQKFVRASLTALMRHKVIGKIAVVEGCVKMNEHSCNKDGLSVDNTHQAISEGIIYGNNAKLIYDRYGWANDKSELRNRALELLGKNFTHILVVDADEVWKQEDLDKLEDYIEENPDVSTIWFKALHFWKKPTLLTVGSQWDAKLFRFFKYEDKTLHWERHELPVVNEAGESIEKLGREVTLDINFYHYGALKDEKDILNKLEYYAKRDTHLPVKNTWSKWKLGKETQWTHGGGDVIKYEGTHPPEVEGLI